MKEYWKQVPGYPLYECSTFGNIRNIKNKHLLKPAKDKNGYKRVVLCLCGRHKNITVHRVVAITFLENTHNLPQINHKDGDKTNNKLSNLEWCSNYQNIHHAIDNGLINVKGAKNPNSKLTDKDVKQIKKMFATGKYNKSQLAREFSVSHTLIRYIVEGKNWR